MEKDDGAMTPWRKWAQDRDRDGERSGPAAWACEEGGMVGEDVVRADTTRDADRETDAAGEEDATGEADVEEERHHAARHKLLHGAAARGGRGSRIPLFSDGYNQSRTVSN